MLKTRKPFQSIITSIQQLNLLDYLKDNKLLFTEEPNQQFKLNDSKHLTQLVDIGILRPVLPNTYEWTSNFLHDFVVNSCCEHTISIPLPITKNYQLDIVNLIETAVKNIDLSIISQPQTTINPPEALFQAELYVVIKTMLRYVNDYTPFIEGHPTKKSKMRYDLLIHNQFKWVIELKVNWSSKSLKEAAISQVKKYAQLVHADRPVVINFSDGRKEEQHLEYDDMDLDTDIDVVSHGVLFITVVFKPGFTELIEIVKEDITLTKV